MFCIWIGVQVSGNMFCIILCVHRVWNPSLNLNPSLTVIISHKAVERVRWSILVRLTYICTKCFKILADDIIKTPMEHSETVSPQVIKEGRFGSERKCSPWLCSKQPFYRQVLLYGYIHYLFHFHTVSRISNVHHGRTRRKERRRLVVTVVSQVNLV